MLTGITISEIVKDDTPIPPPDYEALITQIADEILAEHTPARYVHSCLSFTEDD